MYFFSKYHLLLTMTTDSPGNTSIITDLNCPCKSLKPTAKVLRCSEIDCKYGVWHATCAGHAKPTQTMINSIKEWTCPRCTLKKLPTAVTMDIIQNDLVTKQYLDDLLTGVYDRLEKIEKSTSDINMIVKNNDINKGLEKLNYDFVQNFESIEKNINSKMDSQERNVKLFSEAVAENKTVNSKTSVAISSINKNFENLKSNVESKFNQEKETKEKLAKENNICIFNVPESIKSTTDESQARLEDVKKLHSILDKHITLEKEDVLRVYRKKIRDENKPRPIIIMLKSKEKRTELLKLRGLMYEEQNDSDDVTGITPIYISKDRTRLEQEQNKILVLELKRRRKNGENIYIRNGKIVQYQPFRGDAQLYWA